MSLEANARAVYANSEATDAEFGVFLLAARKLGLDPVAGEICLVPYGGKHQPQITNAGRLVIASRTGELDRIDGPYWCGPRRYREDGKPLDLDWSDVWDGEGYPYAARCFVYRSGLGEANGTAKWSEFAQYKKDGSTLIETWAKYPSHMLGKTALSLALRRRFPEVEAAVAAAADFDITDEDVADRIMLAEANAELPPVPSEPSVPSERQEPAQAESRPLVSDRRDSPVVTTVKQLLSDLGNTLADYGYDSVQDPASLNNDELAYVLNAAKRELRARAMREK